MGMTLSGVQSALARMNLARDAADAAITEAFCYGGEYAVRGIRTGGMSGWNDQTGNLRSSIGYVVMSGGRTVGVSGFEAVGGGAEGSSEGKRVAARLAREYSQYPHALIVVAGMEYAAYVEAIDGKVVLAGGQLWLEGNIGKVVRSRIEKAMSKLMGT